jgi:uncharacterized protein YdeI (YjbR/CyaY-like superfamily)
VSGRSNSATERYCLSVPQRNDWAAWLEKNHLKSDGLWLRVAKNASAVEKNSDRDQTWLQQFCPRSHQSIWSRINRGKALTLIESGIMQPAGLEAVQRAKKDGCWRFAMIRQAALAYRVICRSTGCKSGSEGLL